MDTSMLEKLDDQYLASVMKVRFFPMSIASARGSRITDVDGKSYLDFTAAWAVANLGYNNERVKRAVAEEFSKTTFGTLTAMMNEQSVRLAERLIDLVPGDFDKKVWYGMHGSDANDCIAKLVPMATGRPRMISFIGGYHGQTAGSAALSGHTAQAKVAGAGNVVKIPFPDPYRPVLGTSKDCSEAVLNYLENYILKTICPPEDTAGIIVEPMQSDGGDIVPPPQFLRGLEDICRRHGIMLIIDEVKIGFGRSGRMFAFEHSGVTPDAVSLGKSMGGGFPISAVVGRKEILDVGTAINMYTMAGHPAACAAANAHLDEIEALGIVDKAAATGRLLLAGLEDLKNKHPLVGDVRGLGMMLGLETVLDRGNKEPAAREMAKIVYRCYELGLLVFYGGIYSNVMEITPPLTLTEDEVGEGLEILDRAIGEVEAGEVPDEKLGSYVGW
ncbi:MAG TPA: aspartate aminotransferase family protein [Actinomycetota bacterium]|jgi:4-aminobutyrate aminotransferase|nr:aspartate aminotransferase family protein [Actinomycetota bacterium]